MAEVPSLEIRGLSKIYPAAPGIPAAQPVSALRDINLRIATGEFVCLLGPSGCGKSTLIRSVSRLTDYDEGQILVAGRTDYRPGTDVCMVFQNHGLFPWLTAIRNVEYGLKSRRVPPGERRDVAAGYLDKVGLAGFAHHYPHQLSGGMQQRVGLARALACQPGVLLMDEPFAAVDAQTRERLQAELLELWAQSGMTVVFVTHSIDEAVYLADRIVIMGKDPGRMIADLAVTLPRPRNRENLEYVSCARQVRDLLRNADAATTDEEVG